MLNRVAVGAIPERNAPLNAGSEPPVAPQAATQAQTNADLARANAQLAREQARDQIRTQVRDAIRGTNDAVNSADVEQPPVPPAVPTPPTAPFPPGGSPTIVIPNGAGEDITINVDGSGIHVSQNGQEAVIPIRDVVPRGAVLMTYAVCASFAFIIVGWPLARAFSRWLDRRGAANSISAAMQQRLDAMDRNIDTVAVELERVSEGQRFTAKLLTDRGQMPAPEHVAAGARAPIDRSHG